MDWSLLSCGRGGHVTYAPDEPAIHRQLRATTADGEAWRCLRCATFVPGPPGGHGPADSAPQVRRGKEVRSTLILRIFAVERYLRALVFAGAAFGVWRFSYSHTSLEETFDRATPALRRLYQDLGYNFSHSRLVGLVRHALRVDSNTLRWLALGLLVYAAVEAVEGTGLWLARRWGEYFAMIATSVFLPYEVYELTSKVTALRLAAFLVNLALVVYLVVSKRLFGVRGGKRAYEEMLREDSVIGQATEAADAASAAEPAQKAAPGAEPAPDAGAETTQKTASGAEAGRSPRRAS
jgi:uncharacterized membrane protein (DUF2068 family)